MSCHHLLLGFLLATACARAPAEPAAPAIAAAAPVAIDLTRDGEYKSGRWAYTVTIIAPGSKSEGILGELKFDDQPVPLAAFGDYYATPWGPVQWMGDPEVMWGEHGWLPREPTTTGGNLLPEPAQTP